MFLTFSVAGIILSVILLSFNARKYPSSLYLGGFFFLISHYSFLYYALIYSKSVVLVGITYYNTTFLSYLMGPMLFWYVRSILTDDPRLKRRDMWHLLPAALFLVTTIPYLFTQWSYKTGIASRIIADIGYLSQIRPSVLFEIVPGAIIFMSRPFLVLVYALWSVILFVRYLKQKKDSYVLPRQHYMMKWITIFLGFVIVLSITHLVSMGEAYAFRNLKLFFTLKILQTISGIGMAGLLISPFFFPGILYGLPRLPKPTPVRKPVNGEKIELPAEKKKQSVFFESDYMRFVENKVDKCMKELQPYLQRDCNLASLSKVTLIPVHHLAYYFRENRKQPFNDYRNRWRVDHAKKLIREGKANEMTLEAIGLLSGFSTRNTFFTAFKKAEGVPPSTYSSKFSD